MRLDALKSRLLSTASRTPWWCRWCGETIGRMGSGGRPRAFCNSECVERALADAKIRHKAGERIPDEINRLCGQLRAYRQSEARAA